MKSFFLTKKTWLRATLALLVVSVLCFAAFFVCNALTRKSTNVLADIAEEAENKLNDTFEENYYVGAEVEWPSSIDIPNSEITADNGVVVWPNGEVTSTGKLSLTQMGDYVIKYYYEIDGEVCVAEKNVFVGDKLVKLSADGGSITAVSAAEQAVEGVKFENNTSNVTMQKDDALIVRMKEGINLTYTKSIDLSNVDENGLCTLITLDYHMLDLALSGSTYSITTRSANTCYVRIADAYDTSLYVDLAYSSQDRYNEIASSGHVTARAYNQSYYQGAHVAPDNWTTEYTWRKLYTPEGDVKYGVYMDSKPVLGPNAVNVAASDHTAITWKYDPVNQYVYYNCGTSKGLEKDMFLTPLNSLHIQGSAKRLFPGFPSGKVRLSVIMANWENSNEARVDIFRIGETYGADLIDEFNNGYHNDDVGTPSFEFDTKFTEGKSINVAYNTEFEVPVPSKIVGALNSKKYSVEAYVNYGTPSQFETPIVNGKLKLDRKAIYTLRYTAINASGGVGEELITLVVDPNASVGIALGLDEAFFNGNFESGQNITLPAHTLTSINIAEDLALKITAKHAKTNISVNTSTRNLTLPYAGEYKIVYEYKDNVYNLSKEFTISATAANNVGFLDALIVPKYFIKNAEYSLPEINGYLLSGADQETVEVKAYISYDGGAYTEISREKVKIQGNSTAQVKYVCTGAENTAEIISNVAKIVDVGYGIRNGLLYREYFDYEGFTTDAYDSTLKNNDVKYTTIATSGNSTLKFINAIDYTSLAFNYKANANANYKKINVKLVDYYDPSITYVISIADVGGTAHISFNGAEPIDSTLAFTAVKAKSISYNNESSLLRFDTALNHRVRLDEIFNSSLCYLEIELVDLYGQADFVVDAINSQNFRNSAKSDTGNPRLSAADLSGNRALGTYVTIPVPTVTDVLSPILDENIKLTVKHVETGEVATDVNGVKLSNVLGVKEYTFKLEQLGEYKIQFSFKDGNNKSSMKNLAAIVVDSEKPVVTFNKIELSEIRIKTGTNVDASFTVTDNIEGGIVRSSWVRDTATNVNYTCHDPNGIIYFNKAGEYIIYAFAKDKAGNYTYATVKVIVEDEVA